MAKAKREPIADPVGPLHLLKMAVGVDDIDHLRGLRAARMAERGGGNWVYTRNHPRRTDEVLAGGSIYWVIRGQIRVRQRVVGFRSAPDENGRRYCLIDVDDDLVVTLPRAWRPFQGWRYLLPQDVPPDLATDPGAEAAADDGRPPERLLAELRALGLL